VRFLLPEHSPFGYNRAVGTKEDVAFAAEELGDAKVLLRNLATLHDEQEEDTVFDDNHLHRLVLKSRRHFAFSDRSPPSGFFMHGHLIQLLTHSRQQTNLTRESAA
jgi:hypothetical protein